MKLLIPSPLQLLFIVSLMMNHHLCSVSSDPVTTKKIKSGKMVYASMHEEVSSNNIGSQVHQHYFVDNFRSRVLTTVDGSESIQAIS
ncbi:unnamed protein product [Linum trigynum]|uniref:Uncharacterized protein n=1 Tax=Linum trigynum TaxID=586398 RepID=A0AAV2GLW7_9ROSI